MTSWRTSPPSVRAALLAHRHDRCDLVLEHRHPLCLWGRRQLAAVFRPARVVGNMGAWCDRQFRALLPAHRLARASLGFDLDVRASWALSLARSIDGPMPAFPSGAVV
jgi:hypothetical protein